MKIRMRSWLFAPGDSERKMAKALASDADIALLDLEDSVSADKRPEARKLVVGALEATQDRGRVWVRINPLDTPDAIQDLAAVIPSKPGGIFLPKAEGSHHVTQLHHYLTAFEAAYGLDQGSTKVAALITETPAAMYTTREYADDYPGRERLVGLSWGAEDLSSALGAREQRGPDGEYAHVYELARSLCLLASVNAGVAPIETVQPEFRDLDALETRAQRCRAAGFRGMLAIHPAQIAPINAAFTPSEQEIAHARAIVKAFADNPGAGTIAIDGAMLDRPHLSLAQRLLAEASDG
ncbi:MAG: CoA ester lyase [Pseudomonadota bacterium]|nr:CoA ester lyase [Pseudomonadota bacterium]